MNAFTVTCAHSGYINVAAEGTRYDHNRAKRIFAIMADD